MFRQNRGLKGLSRNSIFPSLFMVSMVWFVRFHLDAELGNETERIFE